MSMTVASIEAVFAIAFPTNDIIVALNLEILILGNFILPFKYMLYIYYSLYFRKD